MIDVLPVTIDELIDFDGGIENGFAIFVVDDSFDAQMSLKGRVIVGKARKEFSIRDFYLPDEIDQCIFIIVPKIEKIFAWWEFATAEF